MGDYEFIPSDEEGNSHICLEHQFYLIVVFSCVCLFVFSSLL